MDEDRDKAAPTHRRRPYVHMVTCATGVPNLVHDYHSLGGGVNSFSSHPARTTRNPPNHF